MSDSGRRMLTQTRDAASNEECPTIEIEIDDEIADDDIRFGAVMITVGLVPYVLIELGGYLHEVHTGLYGNELHWAESIGMNVLLMGSLVLLPAWPIFGIIAIGRGLIHKWKL